MIYDIGDQVQVSTVVRDLAGAINNAATLSLAVTAPDGITTSPSVANTNAAGVYTAAITVNQAGTWAYVWTATGAVVAAEPGQFTVAAPRVYVASLEEAKKQLNRTDNTDDAEIRGYLASATDWVEKQLDTYVSPQTVTERRWIDGEVVPRRRPLISVTSLTPDAGDPLDVAAYDVDTDLGVVQLRYASCGWYTLVYRAGLTRIPEAAKLAGLIIVQHLWDTQNGQAGRRELDDWAMARMGYAVPHRAQELMDGLPDGLFAGGGIA